MPRTMDLNNACDICNQRAGAAFATISKRYRKYTHIVKAHVCSICRDILDEQAEFDGTTVETICQQDYNEIPAVQDIPHGNQ